MEKKPGILMGAFIGGLLMIPVIAISYLGQQVAGLPFTPSILFAFGRDYAPGDLVPRMIEIMSSVIVSLNLGRVDVVAKQIEHLIELSTLVILGIIAGAVFFAVMRRRQAGRGDTVPGVILGIVIAALVIIMMLALPQTGSTDLLISSIWIAVQFILWGMAVSWVYNMLAYEVVATDSATDQASAHVLNRRQFLVRVGAASATITVIGAGLGALLNQRNEISATEALSSGEAAATPSVEMASLSNANDPVVPAPGTRPEVTALEDHYRIDIATTPPRVEAEGYTLPFTTALTSDGSVQTLTELTLDDIQNNYDIVEAFITMSCISNNVGGDLISTIKWTGVSMQQVLAGIDVPADATHIRITSADGFDEIVALDLINSDERVMLAYAWEDQPLTVEHGFPLRIHIPDRYGMKQPKWITGMEFVADDLDGYWVRRGWDKQALARATSVIDTVATENMITDEDGHNLIPIGGIAWAGARGISRVEVSVDDGEWREAQLRAPISDRTWQIWRYDWAFEEGTHKISVRCFETDGTPQIDQIRPVFPSGATGIYSVRPTI
jgi:DMSO/TMAO reductase YedYZ molybdopterin-dependent catalytic subunit